MRTNELIGLNEYSASGVVRACIEAKVAAGYDRAKITERGIEADILNDYFSVYDGDNGEAYVWYLEFEDGWEHCGIVRVNDCAVVGLEELRDNGIIRPNGDMANCREPGFRVVEGK